MTPSSAAEEPIRFGNYEVDQGRRVLLRRGVPVRIQDKPWSVLLHLLRHSDRLVTREELRRELWPSGTYVDFDRGLTVAVHKLRAALDDTSDSPRFIETVPGQGYRFIAPVILQRSEVRVNFHTLLVVLPFAGFASSAAEIEHVADAFTEELTAQMSKISPGQLGVIGRTTAMFYKGAAKTVAAIGAEIDVDYVLEGSVQNEDGTLRVVAQLIRVSDQCHVWSESVEHENDNMIRARVELADRIARTLAAYLFPNRTYILRTRTKHQPSEEAYRLYAEARAYYCPGTDARTGALGTKYLHEVISMDPEFAEAHALLSIMYTGAAMFDAGVVFDASIPTIALQGKQFARRAVELDPESGEANAAVAFQEFQYGWNWTSAERHYKRALELNPNFAWAHMLYAWSLLQRGFQHESHNDILTAKTLDPLSVFFDQWVGILRYYSHDYEGAIEWLEDLLRRRPDYGWTRFFLAGSYTQAERHIEAVEQAHKFVRFSEHHAFGVVALIRAYAGYGKREEAMHWLQALENSMSIRTVNPYRYAVALASLGELDRSFDSLEKAFRQRSGWIPHLTIDPELTPLHGDPRWKPLVERVSATMT